MKMALYLCSLPCNKTLPQSKHEKDITLIIIKRHSTKYRNNTLQNYQGYEKQIIKSEKMVADSVTDMTTRHNIVSWIRYLEQRKTHEKPSEILIVLYQF